MAQVVGLGFAGGHSGEALAHVGVVLNRSESVSLVGLANALVLGLESTSVYGFDLFATIVSFGAALHYHLRSAGAISDMLNIKSPIYILIPPLMVRLTTQSHLLLLGCKIGRKGALLLDVVIFGDRAALFEFDFEF